MTLTTTSPTSSTPAVRDNRVWIVRDAIAEAFRKARFAQRAAYRRELFRLARQAVPDLTDAELDAGLRAMVAAGNLQARKVNGKTMYHYTHFWQRQDARNVADPDPLGHFAPNVIRDGVWWTPDHTATLATIARPLRSYLDGMTVTVTLWDEEKRAHTGTGADVREAYRAACRQQRLARHTVPDLLRQVAGLQRTLATYERKVAADGALQSWLYEEMGRLRARNVELARENEELKREAVGESLADDLLAIIASLTEERDALRAQVDKLIVNSVYLRQQADEAQERLDNVRAALEYVPERERLPF